MFALRIYPYETHVTLQEENDKFSLFPLFLPRSKVSEHNSWEKMYLSSSAVTSDDKRIFTRNKKKTHSLIKRGDHPASFHNIVFINS